MVAYSFKRSFVTPIRIGLGIEREDPEPGAPRAKRQTIRAIGLRRHARPGETLQLYTAMRTKQCQLIGNARCVSVDEIIIAFPKDGLHRRQFPKVRIGPAAAAHWLVGDKLEAFALSDGFATWADLEHFWAINHPGVKDFAGILIRWEPL